MTVYVALLRGINVGNRRMKMAHLREGFASWGYEPVKTIQAAGNVIFEAEEQEETTLAETLEQRLEARYGYEVPVVLRTMAEIEALVEAQPFAGVQVTPETRLYVSFLKEPAESELEIPYETAEKEFVILSASEREVFSVLTLNPNMRTTDSMAILEQAFDSLMTTRNWNTVKKIADIDL